MLAVSCAVAEAGSQLSLHPLFLYLSSFHIHSTSPAPQCPPQMAALSLKVDLCSDTSETDRAQSPLSPPGEMSVLLPHLPPSRAPMKYSVPLPVVAVMGQGAGKLKVREICLCPLPGAPMPHQMKMLERLYYELGKCLSTKLGVSSINGLSVLYMCMRSSF